MWTQEKHTLKLTESGIDLLTFRCDPDEAKTFLHPVRAPGQETVLTDLYPSDHIWHRGVWWSWKYINNINYWEEDPNHVSEGLTRLDDCRMSVDGPSAEIDLRLSYFPPGQEPVLTEERSIHAGTSENGLLRVDYHFSFQAKQAATLRATAVAGEPNGRWFGGYSGFSVRRSAETKAWGHLDSLGRTAVDEIHGQTARWLRSGGAVPEGEASLAVLNHPENPRTPAQWYVFGENLPYFSPAPLFGGALVLQAGDTIAFQYRLLIANRLLDADAMNREYACYAAGDGQTGK